MFDSILIFPRILATWQPIYAKCNIGTHTPSDRGDDYRIGKIGKADLPKNYKAHTDTYNKLLFLLKQTFQGSYKMETINETRNTYKAVSSQHTTSNGENYTTRTLYT